MTARTRTDILLLAGFCAFLFFYGLGQFGLIGADEPRYAQVAREMMERGDWVTPTLAGRPWLEKPPLYYWEAGLVYRVIGVSDVAARIPSAFDATLLVIAVYLFFRKFRRGAEVDAALITASCAGVIGYSRAASMDMPLAATFSIGLLAWWAWRESGKRTYLVLFYLLMALGTLAKGPVAPLLAGIVVILISVTARDARLIVRTLWIPGILLFIGVALPWYLAVQLRHPEFFREFILEHNLARFSSNLYHHPEPFWFYVPVTLLALVPWTVVAIVAVSESWQVFLAEGKTVRDIELQFRMFAASWLLVPVIFFSLSQSKLPGYILPAIPGGALLVADYLLRHRETGTPIPKWLAVVHAAIASAPIVPAVVIGYLVMQHRLPHGTPMYFALILAVLVFAGVAITLAGRMQLRMLRFVTLIPVLLAVAAVLKFGTAAIDQKLSARPLALEISSIETKKLPIAVAGVQRELEYGLGFYRNQPVHRYESGDIPIENHLLVAPTTWRDNVFKATTGRRVSLLGHYTPQAVDYYWVAALANKP